MDLDTKDFALLEALQENASQRLEELARLVNLAPSSVHDRLRRLERGGIIKKWTVKLDTSSLGLGVLAFIGLQMSRPCSEILEAIRDISAIEECHSIAGRLCMMLKVRSPDTAGLLALVERLRRVPGIESTETTIVLQTMFDRPVALKTIAAAKKER